MCSRTYWCHLGNGRQTMVQTLPPTCQVSPYGSIAEQGVLRFSGKKIFPGLQVSGPVSMAIRKRLSPKWPIESRLIQRVSSSTNGARRLLGNVVVSNRPSLVGELQRPEFFSVMSMGGIQGGQSAVRQAGPACLGRAVEEEKAVIGWFWSFCAQVLISEACGRSVTELVRKACLLGVCGYKAGDRCGGPITRGITSCYV